MPCLEPHRKLILTAILLKFSQTNLEIMFIHWAAVVTPTDRPKSVRNRYVIELFCGVVCIVTLPF